MVSNTFIRGRNAGLKIQFGVPDIKSMNPLWSFLNHFLTGLLLQQKLSNWGVHTFMPTFHADKSRPLMTMRYTPMWWIAEQSPSDEPLFCMKVNTSTTTPNFTFHFALPCSRSTALHYNKQKNAFALAMCYTRTNLCLPLHTKDWSEGVIWTLSNLTCTSSWWINDLDQASTAPTGF